MTNVFKVLKADVHNFFHTLGERDCFRPTGDCSYRNNAEMK